MATPSKYQQHLGEHVFVMSARQAGVMDGVIRNNGRWTSVGGPVPYTIDTLVLISRRQAPWSSTTPSVPEKVPGHFAPAQVGILHPAHYYCELSRWVLGLSIVFA